MNEIAQEKRVDRRVAKTRKAIHEAFRKLVLTKDLSKITVSELAHEADIDRKTFYLHFSSINDLIQWETSLLIDRVAEALLANTQISQNSQSDAEHDTSITTKMKKVLFKLAEIINEDEEFNSRMFSLLPMSGIAEALFDPIYSAALKEASHQTKENPQALGYVVRFYIAGTLSLFISWINEGRVQPIENIVNIFTQALKEHKQHDTDAGSS